jgi:4-amino-4-deoxy-L-arabinose transferase-like glycosyltransferase
MSTPPSETLPWWRDRRLLTLVIVTVALRLILEALWPNSRCVRDECMYLFTAERMAEGLGMTASNGWIWAPAHIFLLSVVHRISGGYAALLVVPQALFCGVAVLTLYRIGLRLGSERAALLGAWVYALHPTIVFFATRLWSETVYATLLLLALLGLLRARDGVPGRAASTGALVGLCVLLRGVATYMLPIFALGLLWDRWRKGQAWGQAASLVIAAALVVSPYSLYASQKFDSFIISDRTMGQMMWLGNNDFEPITFDYGNGQLSQRGYDAQAALGREHCAPKERPVERDRCETQAGKQWIRDNPQEFLRRVPLRLAQLFNPNSFLTRHLRQGGWKNLPDALDELICVLVVLASFLTVLGSAVGAWGRRLSVYLLVVGLTTAYHLAAVGALAGLSRYRVPLDVIWLPFVGIALAAPLASLRQAARPWWRLVGLLFTVGVLLWLMIWFLPAGFPWWKSDYPLWSGWLS